MKTVDLTHEVPEIFLRLAKFYQVEPDQLASAIIFGFCSDPPRHLILVERDEWEELPVAVLDRISSLDLDH